MDATYSNYGYHKVDLLISITLISGIHVLAEIWLSTKYNMDIHK